MCAILNIPGVGENDFVLSTTPATRILEVQQGDTTVTTEQFVDLVNVDMDVFATPAGTRKRPAGWFFAV